MISYVTTAFSPTNKPLDGRYITASGYRGLLYRSVLDSANPRYREWLHDHPDPKPFSMVPYYDRKGHLAGLRYTAFDDECANILADSWQIAQHQQKELQFGKYQKFSVENVQLFPCADWVDLAETPADREMVIDFVSPTLFKQGEGYMPLPMPRNVFMRPLKVWNHYAPEVLSIPEYWLNWVEDNIFIEQHDIQTVPVSYDRKNQEIGFVGRVKFKAGKKAGKKNLQYWQTLGHLLPICGTGSRTTVGFGAVERSE